MMSKFLFASGWKMNFTSSEVEAYLDAFLSMVDAQDDRDILFLPSFPALTVAHDKLRGTGFLWGAQDVHAEDRGAHTGDVSGRMLADLGCSHVMVGHAERRRDHGETDDLVAAKLAAARRWGITPILCVGDTVRGHVEAAIGVVAKQLEALDDCIEDTVVAYEPVWAIGSGTAADEAWIEAVHSGIGRWLGTHRPSFAARGRLAYGGSVSTQTGERIVGLAGVEGLFVGSASADPTRFAEITAVKVPQPTCNPPSTIVASKVIET